MTALSPMAKAAVGISAGIGAGLATEQLWSRPLRQAAAEPRPDNGLAHFGAGALAFGPGLALLKWGGPSLSNPALRAAALGATVGAGISMSVTGVIEGARGIARTDPKFLLPWALTD